MRKNEKNKNKTIDNPFLRDAIYLVKEEYKFAQSSMQLAHAISVEFDCLCTKEHIEDYFLTNMDDLMEEEDKRLIYEHVT